jgi:WD40 repeat protein
LASSSYDDTIKIWREDDDDWVCVATLTGHSGTVWCSDFQKSVDSIRLVSGSDDGCVKIWKQVDEENWELEATLPAVHTRAVYSVSWSSSGRIASTGSDGQLVIYDEKPEGWTVIDIKKLAHGVQEVNTVQWCKSYGQGEEWLITGGDDGDVNIWRI